MEVVMTEEKKKIFRARKTMKMSDRQQLESLHTTLVTSSGLSNPSPPPLMNGTHKDDGPIMGDKEQANALESNSPNVASPGSPAPFLSLSLSPSPSSSQSPKAKEENSSTPTSPFHSINFEIKKMAEEEEDKNGPVSPSINDPVSPTPTDSEESKEKEKTVALESDRKEEQKKTTSKTKDVVTCVKSPVNTLAPSSAQPPSVSDCTEPVDTDNDTTDAMEQEASTDTGKHEKPSSPKSVKSVCSSMPSDGGPKQEVKVNAKLEKDVDVKPAICEEMMEGVEMKDKGTTCKPPRPSSTPPSCTVKEEMCSTSGIKRTLSEESEYDRKSVKREGKRPKMEFEAQLELKFSTKAGSHQKLEKIVQQLVEKHLKVLELTIFERDFQDLKKRVDKIECASKHQTAINSLQAKIARLSKKFGEANQATENKKKQEALAAANAAISTAKTASGATTQPQGPSRTGVVVKQTPTTASSSITAANPGSVLTTGPTSTSTSLVPQAPLLHLINTTSNVASNVATGITTQSPTGTLVLKTASGSNMVATAQPLLIQLPLSVANGQAGTLVNIPVSLSATAPLNKPKTTASTATFILKPAATTTTVPAAIPAAASVPVLQAPTAQMGQISLARAVYQGGTGGISTPSAGVSVTTAKTPAQSVSVAGAVSSTSSPTASGPAATGSTAPGPPQGTSLTTKTDNQVTGTTSSKPTATRPKGSVIDLTEDDDDVQVTGVKSASVAVPSPTQRPSPVVGTLNSVGARSSPQSSFTSNPQLTVHHRPPLDTPVKSRTVTSTTPNRGSTMTLPPLPVAPALPRLPSDAERTSPPQQPQLKLVPSQNGIVLSWCVAETDRTCANVDSYHLYAYHQDNSNTNVAQQHWKKIGEVKALPLPMACTLTQFQSGSTYHFAVRAKDIYGRFGPFCEPQCTNVINSNPN